MSCACFSMRSAAGSLLVTVPKPQGSVSPFFNHIHLWADVPLHFYGLGCLLGSTLMTPRRPSARVLLPSTQHFRFIGQNVPSMSLSSVRGITFGPHGRNPIQQLSPLPLTLPTILFSVLTAVGLPAWPWPVYPALSVPKLLSASLPEIFPKCTLGLVTPCLTNKSRTLRVSP